MDCAQSIIYYFDGFLYGSFDNNVIKKNCSQQRENEALLLWRLPCREALVEDR